MVSYAGVIDCPPSWPTCLPNQFLMLPQILHILTGPTAVGKTELSLEWAEQYGAEIVSCDSLLFYRGMNIGTAKPRADELARVPHHLIDIHEPDSAMTIADYVARAERTVADIVRRGKRVLVTGGSGFYLKAFFGPVVDRVAVSAELREQVETKLMNEGLASLVKELKELNPAGLGGLDAANPRRVTRALERCRASGKTLQRVKAEFDAQPGAFSEFQINGVCLTREPEELNQRIALRVDHMLAEGLVAEVRGLLDQGLDRNPSAVRSIGYRETVAMLAGELPESELPAAIVKNTKALVRKQRTWFRNQLPELRTQSAADARSATLFDSPSMHLDS